MARRKKRGFFAEMQHQQALKAKQAQRVQAVAAQEQARRLREWEQARRAEERATAAHARASVALAQEAERLAKARHVDARLAEVETMNGALAGQLADLDSLLHFTLDIDDYVDLASPRAVADLPGFESYHKTRFTRRQLSRRRQSLSSTSHPTRCVREEEIPAAARSCPRRVPGDPPGLAGAHLSTTGPAARAVDAVSCS